jgi:hypothetical protein
MQHTSIPCIAGVTVKGIVPIFKEDAVRNLPSIVSSW